MNITITTNGTAAGYVNATLPDTVGDESFVAIGMAAAGSGKALVGHLINGGANMLIYNYDGTYPGASGEVLVISGEFLAA